jgi:hypothetical protein
MSMSMITKFETKHNITSFTDGQLAISTTTGEAHV